MSNKKRIKIVVFIIIMFIVMIGLFFVGLMANDLRLSKNYNFTTTETMEKYKGSEGYNLYENKESGVSFLYPSDWIVAVDTPTEILIANPNVNNGVAGQIYYTVVDEEESMYTEEDYSTWKASVMLDGVIQFDEVWYEGANVERCLEVNGKKTFMWYNNMHPVGYEEYTTFDLSYYSILPEGKVAYVEISSNAEEITNTIAGTLVY